MTLITMGTRNVKGCILSAASAFLLTMYQFTSDLYRTDSKSEHVCCSTSASLYTRCNE